MLQNELMTLKLLILTGLEDKPGRESEEYIKNILNNLAAVN